MQYRVNKTHKKIARKKAPKTLGVFDAIISKYAQAVPVDTTTIDPTQVQQGQSVYDPTGKEYLIVEDDPTTTHKTLMPADQRGKDVPEGITTVDDSELSVDYSVQEPDSTVVAYIAPEFRRTK